MSRRALSFTGSLILVAFAILSSASGVRAGPQTQPGLASSPLELIGAVNVLRASYGLSPYTINSILMYTAQSQADFMAATGSMTHFGPNGIGLTDRLLAAGYPLAGDLSLGGFRSENITGGHESKTAQEAVNGWTGDAPHLTTMISPNLTEIGAGVAVSGGRVYYVIDAARPTDGGAPQLAVPSMGGGSAVPEGVAVIIPVTRSTPNADGNLIHEVQAGQTLWQIAIAYDARVDEIKGLNNLFDNNIYPGNRLLIKSGIVPTGSPTEVLAQAITTTSTRLPTSTAATLAMSTPAAERSSVSANNPGLMKVALGIIALALLGGGFFTWLGSRQKN